MKRVGRFDHLSLIAIVKKTLISPAKESSLKPYFYFQLCFKRNECSLKANVTRNKSSYLINVNNPLKLRLKRFLEMDIALRTLLDHFALQVMELTSTSLFERSEIV
jgi:hypothetical protein